VAAMPRCCLWLTSLQLYFNELCLQKDECMSVPLDLVNTLYQKWAMYGP
jgi:hypothetical protein